MKSNWRQIKIKNIFQVKSGQGFKASEYVSNGVPLLQIENVGYGEVKWKKKNYLSPEYLKKYPNLHLKEGDIVLALNRPVTNNKLKIAMLKKSDTPSILYQRVGKIIVNNDVVRKEYLYQISNIFLKKFVLSQSIGSDQPYIAMKDLYKYKLILPPLPEQHRIVTILETWDKTIDLLTKKIVLKKEVKKGLMQKLLTGDVRLPGFSGEWKKQRLEDICVVEKSNVAANSLESNVGNYDVFGASGFIKKIDFYEQSEPYIAIVKDGAGVGRLTLHTERTSVLGTLDVILPKDNIELTFLYPLLQTVHFKKYIVGSTIPHIYFKDYKIEKIKVPVQKEQKVIAKILTTSDQEIETLEIKLKTIKQQKKFLLNNLVTGEIRTPENLISNTIK